MAQRERTFIMIKPDAVQRGLIGDIIKRFEQKGFKLVAMKLVQVTTLVITTSVQTLGMAVRHLAARVFE